MSCSSGRWFSDMEATVVPRARAARRSGYGARVRLRRLIGHLCLAAALFSPSTAAADDGVSRATNRPVLRVVTFNVFQDVGAALHRQDWLALRHRADVVLLQE